MSSENSSFFQNFSISQFTKPEVDNSKLINKDCLQVNTHLRDIYGKNNIEYIQEKIEPIYEEIKNKFKNNFNNLEPTFFIRIPYTKVLFGDQITNIFEDKILTTIDKDLIICGRETEDYELNIELFDEYYPSVKINLDFDSNKIFQNELYNVDFIKYCYYGYKSAYDLIKPNKNKGMNVLICYNSTNSKNSEKLKSIYLFSGLYLAFFYVSDYLQKISKKNLFEFLYEDLNKVSNFEKEYSHLHSIFFLESNSIGIYFDKNFSQFKVSSIIGIKER